MVVSKKSKTAKVKSKTKSKSKSKKVAKVNPDATILDSELAPTQTVAELKAVAKKMGVSLTGITKKADIIAALSGPSQTTKKSKSKKVSSKSPEISSKQTIAELKAIAKKMKVPLTGITKKADIIKALKVAKAPFGVLKAGASKKSSSPKSASKNSRCRIYLYPYLDDGQGDEDDYGIKTGVAKIDKLIVKRLKEDYIHAKEIFSWDMDVLGYEFDGKYVIIDVKSLGSKKETEEKVFEIMELGPDTWMEGDLRILKNDEIKGTEFQGDVELLFGFHPKVECI